MITSLVNEQFLYWEDDKCNLYPGCQPEDTKLLLVVDNGKLKALFSFSKKWEMHQVDLEKVHPLDIDYVVGCSTGNLTKESLVHVYNQSRVSQEYFLEKLSKLKM